MAFWAWDRGLNKRQHRLVELAWSLLYWGIHRPAWALPLASPEWPRDRAMRAKVDGDLVVVSESSKSPRRQFGGEPARGGSPGRQDTRRIERLTERRDIHYAGRVQGVGFRFTTQRLARQFDVSGTVRNLPDGRVHVVVEGAQDEISKLLSAIDRAMSGNIHSKDELRGKSTGEFATFEVRY